MSTLWFYHLFGIRDYRVLGSRIEGDRRVLPLEARLKKFHCSKCGSEDVVRWGSVVRLLHAISKLLQVGWDLVKSIVKRDLHRRYSRPPLRHIRRIAIDEINLGRRFGFCTVVLDLDSGAVIHVGTGRNAAALEPFWRRLKASRARIAAVATDMGGAYRRAVKKHLPRAQLVVDRFHVVMSFNKKITWLLGSESRKARGEGWRALRGVRWILVKRPENLNEQRDELDRLERALQANRNLMIAHYLEEDLDRFWRFKSKAQAAAHLDDWLEVAKASSVAVIRRLARSLTRFRDDLINWYDHRISTSPLESMNGRIRLIQRRAYGYRDREFLALQISAMHDRIYA